MTSHIWPPQAADTQLGMMDNYGDGTIKDQYPNIGWEKESQFMNIFFVYDNYICVKSSVVTSCIVIYQVVNYFWSPYCDGTFVSVSTKGCIQPDGPPRNVVSFNMEKRLSESTPFRLNHPILTFQEIELCNLSVDVLNAMEPKPKFFIVCGDILDAMPDKWPDIRKRQVKSCIWSHMLTTSGHTCWHHLVTT